MSRSQRRNIPAHAGKTKEFEEAWHGGEEHPRARGENGGEECVIFQHFGTSPRTRGKPISNGSASATQRNIPAHAGKTHTPVSGFSVLKGTSPRTRGKLSLVIGRMCPRRNIPAHAGKTKQPFPVPRRRAEHPRARGENYPPLHNPDAGGGTSPRTRGKPNLKGLLQRNGRNIPAHAGKTQISRSKGGKGTEHPRARGENQARPRARQRRNRNIPAHAGKTLA